MYPCYKPFAYFPWNKGILHWGLSIFNFEVWQNGQVLLREFVIILVKYFGAEDHISNIGTGITKSDNFQLKGQLIIGIPCYVGNYKILLASNCKKPGRKIAQTIKWIWINWHLLRWPMSVENASFAEIEDISLRANF